MAGKTTKSKKQQVQDFKNKASVDKANTVQLDKALGSISGASVQVQSAFSKIGEELVNKHAELKAIDEAITLKKQELENLHGADKALLSIDELNIEYQNTLEDLHEKKRVATIDFDRFQEEARQRWEREENLYKYNLAQQRKQETDAWEEQVRIKARSEKIRQEEFEKNVAERTAALAAQEKQYQDAISKAATFDTEVEKRIKEEVAKVTSAMKRDFDHSSQMVLVRHTSEVDNLNNTINNLSKENQSHEATIRELREQLTASMAAQVQLAKDVAAAAGNKSAQADALALMTNLGGGMAQRAKG
jgi:hypothetical protein